MILGRNSYGSFSLGMRGRKKGTVVEEMGNTGMIHFTGTQQQRREVSNNYKQTFPRIFERERGMEALSAEGNMAEIAKSWGTTVVVTRRSVDTEWWELKETIGSRVARLVEVVPLTANGAVIWCKDEAERNKLLTKRLCFAGKIHSKDGDMVDVFSLGARADRSKGQFEFVELPRLQDPRRSFWRPLGNCRGYAREILFDVC